MESTRSGATSQAVAQGYVDAIVDMTFYGWAWESDLSDRRCVVQFVLDGAVVGEASADRFREDLAPAGIGDGNHAFKWSLPQHVDPRLLDRIDVVVSGRSLSRLNLVPRFGSLEATRLFTGQIELQWPYFIRGALASDEPFARESVSIRSGDTELCTLSLAYDGDIGSPTHGFHTFYGHLGAHDPSSAGADLSLRLPNGWTVRLADLRPPAPPAVVGGAFDVIDNVIEGVVHLHPDAGVQTVRLKVLVDHRLMEPVIVEVGGKSAARFSYPLPIGLLTGRPLSIGVCSADNVPLLASSSELTMTHVPRSVGYVDGFDSPCFSGWVIDHAAEDGVNSVQLYDGPTLIHEVDCSIARQDVNKLFQTSGLHGFEIALPDFAFDGLKHEFSLRCNGELLFLSPGLKMPSVLRPSDLTALDPARRIHGAVEEVTCELVSGWAWDAMRPGDPVDLVVRVDGQAVGLARADRFAARLRGAGRSGHQQFSFRLPPELQNGLKREIIVEELNTRHTLPCKQGAVVFPLIRLAETPAVHRSVNYRPNRAGPPAAASVPDGRAPSRPPVVSMIVLNKDGAYLLEDFFDSLLSAQVTCPFELFLIDHGSTDASAEIVSRYRDRLPIKLIERHRNYSFSASNNHAASLAEGDFLLFANNDLVFQHDCLSRMMRHFEDASVGLVGARLLEPLRDRGGTWRTEPHHEGVRFKVDRLQASGAAYYTPEELRGLPAELAKSAIDMPAVTAALMMCRKADFLAVGGFSEDYFYGLEDVDYCLQTSSRLGKRIICDLDASAIHNRSATRNRKFAAQQAKKLYTGENQLRNREVYIRRFGRNLVKRILISLLEGSSFYRSRPLRVTFAVTDADINTAAGDYFTALELGLSLKKKFGWEICFVKMGQHVLAGTDVLIVMRHDYDLRKISRANPGLITVAWIRNRVDQWLDRPEFDAYNVIFASSEKARDHLLRVAGRKAVLLPIATNPERFSPDRSDGRHGSDVVFTGSYHGAVRGAVNLLEPQKVRYEFALYGYNWDKYPAFACLSRGPLRYDSLGKAYASSKLVLDDSHPVTRDWNSLNSRVFDALASGRVVVTNCVDGAKEAFGKLLPTFTTRAELTSHIDRLLSHPAEREGLAKALRAEVLARHTYDHRADTLKDTLAGFLAPERLRFAIKIGVPSREEREQWGDYHFAQGIRKALESQGHFARIDILPDWEGGLSASDDVVIVLRGLSSFKPQPTSINLMWLISHPEEVSIGEMRGYDHVFVASQSYADRLASHLSDKVSCLLQCTDPASFFPEPDASLDLPKALFIGNSRGVRRVAVEHAMEGDVPFGVIGGGWEGLIPAGNWLGDHVSNDRLRHYYSSSSVILNDHWPDMRAEGFISNRIFDAGACGAAIVSDRVAGVRELFGDAIWLYDTGVDFARQVEEAGRDASRARERLQQLSSLILRDHTFHNRVEKILSVVFGIKGRNN